MRPEVAESSAADSAVAPPVVGSAAVSVSESLHPSNIVSPITRVTRRQVRIFQAYGLGVRGGLGRGAP